MAKVEVLELIRAIGNSEHIDGIRLSTADLLPGRSERTFRRDVEEARALGAELVSERTPEGYVWSCPNFEKIEDELRNLIRFERVGFLLWSDSPLPDNPVVH